MALVAPMPSLWSAITRKSSGRSSLACAPLLAATSSPLAKRKAASASSRSPKPKASTLLSVCRWVSPQKTCSGYSVSTTVAVDLSGPCSPPHADRTSAATQATTITGFCIVFPPSPWAGTPVHPGQGTRRRAAALAIFGFVARTAWRTATRRGSIRTAGPRAGPLGLVEKGILDGQQALRGTDRSCAARLECLRDERGTAFACRGLQPGGPCPRGCGDSRRTSVSPGATGRQRAGGADGLPRGWVALRAVRVAPAELYGRAARFAGPRDR